MPYGRQSGFITPFADQAVRLLREKWANPVMLAEEVFAILQQKIPQNSNGPININLLYGSDQTAVTIRQNGDGDFMKFIDKNGNLQWRLNGKGLVAPTPERFTGRIEPTIVWENPDPITTSDPLGAAELNAVAKDPRSGYEIAGTYTYDPPAGTNLSAGDNQPLSVVFTPSNTTSYKRARKTVFIDVTGAPLSVLPDFPVPLGDGSPSDPVDVPMGALILCFIATSHTAGGVTVSVTDSDGNTYSQIGSYVDETQDGGSTYLRLSAWGAITANANPALTITYTGSAGSVGGVALGYAGVDTSDPIGATASDTHNEISPSLGDFISVATVAAGAGEFVAAACFGTDTGNMSGGSLITFNDVFSVGYNSTAEGGISVECQIAASGVVDKSYVGLGVSITPSP